jgi:histidyl-tRNA synthetase
VADTSKIEPRTLGGFRDYLPEAMIPREWLIDTARSVYRSYGFSPIDTPALEYLEILVGKGGAETDKQLYRFEDQGGRSVGMRFDLTVPLARFAAQHIGKLGTPFKRYHIASVWRGEKMQRGRYREFMQCDFDTIGTLALAADVETALVIHDLFRALGIEDFTIHVNNRMVLTGLLERFDLGPQSAPILRAIDKLAKIGREKVTAEIEAAGVAPEAAAKVLDLVEIHGPNSLILEQLDRLAVGSPKAQEGIARLSELFSAVEAAGVRPERIRIAPAIARGLDYYTGMIYETFLDRLPSIGSVCSGGRYDNLAKLYTNQELPGIGASLGLDRLLAGLEEMGLVQKIATAAPVLLIYFDASRLHDYLHLARELRAAGIGVEFYPEPKKLGSQLKYASERGFRIALILGENEFAAGECQLKVLATGEKLTVSMADGPQLLVEEIRAQLQREPVPAAAADKRRYGDKPA